MELEILTGNITEIEADAVITGIYEETESPDGELAAIDKALDNTVTKLIKKGEIKGKSGEITAIHSMGKLPVNKIIIAGLGKKEGLNADRIRGTFAEVCRFLRSKNDSNITAIAPGIGLNGITAETSAQSIAEGAVLGLYQFRKHQTSEPETGEIKKLTIVNPDADMLSALTQGCSKGKIMAEAANLARDMANEPANFMTPSDMAAAATDIAGKYGLALEVLEKEQMKELGMGALLGVAQGSHQPPKFIIMNYKGSDKEDIDIALVGKGITFDSGGISIKPSQGMGDMKGDMAGGAAVLGAMAAIGQLKPEINVMALVPATENLPGGSALKPADVLKAMNGKTIEIISTDAEGRLILADALSYANTKNVKRIVDVATLTGACVVALGKVSTGAFTNNQELVDEVIAAGSEAGEKMWQMPMFEEYKEQNKSDVADIKNTGGRDAGAITAAYFVGTFAGDTPWVHLDIAGTNDTDRQKNYQIKGATGIPARTLVNLVLSLAKK